LRAENGRKVRLKTSLGGTKGQNTQEQILGGVKSTGSLGNARIEPKRKTIAAKPNTRGRINDRGLVREKDFNTPGGS